MRSIFIHKNLKPQKNAQKIVSWSNRVLKKNPSKNNDLIKAAEQIGYLRLALGRKYEYIFIVVEDTTGKFADEVAESQGSFCLMIAIFSVN